MTSADPTARAGALAWTRPGVQEASWAALRWSGASLVLTALVSALLFGRYILAFILARGTIGGPVVVMAFFFYLPNLLVVEACLRARPITAPYWGPANLRGLAG